MKTTKKTTEKKPTIKINTAQRNALLEILAVAGFKSEIAWFPRRPSRTLVTLMSLDLVRAASVPVPHERGKRLAGHKLTARGIKFLRENFPGHFAASPMGVAK